MRKSVIITGVSRKMGIGFAITKRLVELNYNVCITHCTAYDVDLPGWKSDHQELASILDDLKTHNTKVIDFEIDLTSTQYIKSLFDFTETNLGQIYGLINNAAYSVDTSISDITEQLLDLHYFVNIRAPILLIKEFVKRYHLHSNLNQGRIVNLTSGYVSEANPGNLAYSSSKAALNRFTNSVALEISKSGITINSIDPGPTDTGWMTDEIKHALLQNAPKGRLGTPNDVANLAEFLMSEKSEWITGQILHSRGGF